MNERKTSLPTAEATRWDIQMLRGVAVSWVLLHHAQVPGVAAGYLGVDIFFVISGFLITGLIQRALMSGQRFSFAAFYWRRAKRLLPAAYVTLALTALIAPRVLNALEFEDFKHQLWGALGFASNWVLWQQTGYFQGAAELKPLLHFWSLSLEEQYYAVLPALLLFTPARWRVAMMALLVMVSGALCLLLARQDPGAVFYLLPSRSWELGLGSLGALLGARMPQALRWPAVLALLLLPLWPATGWPHPGPSALLICLATLILLLCPTLPGSRPSAVARGLARLGDVSYSLYLLHWPILAFINNAWLGDAHGALGWRLGGLALALLLSVLMFRYVETPTRRLALPPARWWPAAGVLLLSSSVLMGLPWLMQRHASAGPDYAQLRRPNHGLSAACDYEGPFNGEAICRSGTAAHWMVWGDSFAMHLVPGLVDAAGAAGLVQATKSSCGPFLNLAPFIPARPPGETFAGPWGGQCKAFNDSVLAWLAVHPEVDTVILSSLLLQYLGAPPYTELLQWDATGRAVHVPASPQALLAATRETLRALRRLGKRVVLIAPPPSVGFDIGACVERAALHRWTLGVPGGCELARADYETQRKDALAYLKQVEAELDLAVLRFEPALCDAVRCRVQGPQGELIYRDSGHLSHEGSRLMATELGWARQIPLQAR